MFVISCCLHPHLVAQLTTIIRSQSIIDPQFRTFAPVARNAGLVVVVVVVVESAVLAPSYSGLLFCNDSAGSVVHKPHFVAGIVVSAVRMTGFAARMYGFVAQTCDFVRMVDCAVHMTGFAVAV